jgi:transcriptional regulator with XRE-family HTH domain
MYFMAAVRLRLRALREKSGLTQEDLAIKADLRQALVSNLETGKSQRIDLAALGKIAKALGVKPGDLFEWARAEPRD